MPGLAGAWALGGARARSASPVSKNEYSKERVGYRDEPYQDRTCARCVLYAGLGECAIVEGEVSPHAWCAQWTPATMGQAGPRIA